jgi:hypothetical protein
MSEYILERNYDTKNGTFSTVKREEIVRCKGCKWLKQRDEECGGRDWCKRMSFETQPEGFCAWGERREP